MLFFNKNHKKSNSQQKNAVNASYSSVASPDFGSLRSPSGDILFDIDGTCLKLCKTFAKDSTAWLVAYSRSHGIYCTAEGILLSDSTICTDDLSALGRMINTDEPLAKVRICLYIQPENHCYYLKHQQYAENQDEAHAQYILPLQSSSHPFIYTLSTYLSESGLLSLTKAGSYYAPRDMIFLTPENLVKPDGITLKSYVQMPTDAPVYYGLYSYKEKHMYVFSAADGIIRLSELHRMIGLEILDPETRYYLCMIRAFSDYSCRKIMLCVSSNPESTSGIRPLLLEHQYDSLISSSISLPGGLDAVLRRTNNGLAFLDYLPSEEIYKYHNALTDHGISEIIDDDDFSLFDPDFREMTASYFFNFVQKSRSVLNHTFTSTADLLKVKKRILYNLSEMLLAAVNTKGLYETRPDTSDCAWSDLSALLAEFDDDLIMNVQTGRYMKLFLQHVKYGRPFDLEEGIGDIYLRYGETSLYSIGSMLIRIDLIEIENAVLTIECCLKLPESLADNHLTPTVYINGICTPYIETDRHADEYIFGRLFQSTQGFTIRLPLEADRYKISFGIRGFGIVSQCRTLEFSQVSPLANKLNNAYFYKDNYVVKTVKTSLLCLPCDEEKQAYYEDLLSQEIEKGCGESASAILSLRQHYWKYQKNPSETDTWVMIDRADRADDNAEVLFRYVVQQAFEKVRPVFILSQTSPQFSELSEVGTVFDFRSEAHLKAFLTSRYIFSSQFSPSTMNPFNEDFDYFRDIVRQKKFVFLQHGVTKDDNGMGFSRFARNFYGIIVSGNDEYRYLSCPELSNPPGSVWLTGMPRFDRVYNDDQRIITIMPTWRKYLTTRVFDEEQQTNIWRVKNDYTESEYYNFYNSLINDEDLINAAREKHYRIQLMPHVQFLKQADDFEIKYPDVVTLCNYDTRYCEVFSKSSLILTDFSSIGFDFGYLHKPVVYCQFDKEAFYKNHTMKPGFFDYERDGFGDVLYDLPTTIETLISYIKNDCQMKKKYSDRVDAFFKYTDHHCCERICRKVFELEKNS